MAAFALCRDCRAEYEDPRDRRFHAQPVACPACGPRLRALDPGGAEVAGEPIAWAASQLLEGKTGAIKGIGGWHLACDARDEAAVADLRRRKHRDEKPFALMVRDLAAAEELCQVSAAERALLGSPARPIVLLRKRPGARVAAAVAPDNPLLGVMLPYAPVHHLLLRALGPAPLVMTSGNLSDEPIAFDDRDALARLGGLAGLFLSHYRRIHSRCDDSVVRVVGSETVHFRRSRGYAPLPVRLPRPVRTPTLALGGELKATFALADGENGFLSHHLGDLGYAEAFRAYLASIPQYEALYGIAPRRLVHDLHPDYASTRYAIERAAREGVELVAVQHHHAHMASRTAENGLRGRALGVCFDGMGFGPDGTLWGGEFLLGDCARVERVAHLAPVAMPGGEQATREPWRMAVAHLRAAGVELGPLAARAPAQALRTVDRMLDRSFNAPLTSSMGRLFDAAAAIANVCDAVSCEGQAAIRLESLAATAPADGAYPFDAAGSSIDVRPLIAALARDALQGTAQALLARRFHSTVVALTLQTCARLCAQGGVRDVVLSGGVFLNAILLREVCAGLAARGLRAFRHRLVPPNDGGLSLGQLAVAAARDACPPQQE
ncbi:MAG: carbamoyltransferase HypF [Myxococcales bacterium]